MLTIIDRFHCSSYFLPFKVSMEIQWINCPIVYIRRFVPDFTISRVSNTLRFKTTSGSELLFPLLAILPHNLLAVCYAMQPRPEWEQTIAWLSVPFWICVLVTMVAVVVVQTNFGLGHGVSYQNDRYLPVVQATGGQVFDLKSIGGHSTPPELDRPAESERVKEPVSTKKSRYVCGLWE